MIVNSPQDKTWKEQREARWNKVFLGNFKLYYPEEVCLAMKQWYLEGDLTALMSDKYWTEKETALSVNSIMMACPIIDIDEYIQFFQDYCMWLSEKELDYWGPQKESRDEHFILRFFSNYIGDHTDSTRAIYEHMLGLLLPDDNGTVVFPFELGKDQWQPKLEVALCDAAFDVFTHICRYLFAEEDDYEGYSHASIAMSIVHYMTQLHQHYYSTSLDKFEVVEQPPPPLPRIVNGVFQQYMRAKIANLLGYKNYYNDYEGELRHNDPELEQQLRDLLAGLKMPEEYYKLIDFIHAHPEDYLDASE